MQILLLQNSGEGEEANKIPMVVNIEYIFFKEN